MVTDPIADFLARIRNAQQRKKETIVVPSSKILVAIANILKEEGFVADVKVEKTEPQDNLIVTLKYVNDEPAIRDMVRVSKPGVRKYRGYKEIKPVKSGIGISIFSTPQGVITGENAKKMKVGGEYICYIY